ncbi:hypothetical protein L9G16_06780 [Shewanella sp. A25]|nr:hypothetical protein [Shewanella shenzhenensis]
MQLKLDLKAKRLLAGVICYGGALLLLGYGIYHFYCLALVPPELTRCIALAILSLGLGLESKLFFSSLEQTIKKINANTPRAKWLAFIFNFGVFLLICSVLMEWVYD